MKKIIQFVFALTIGCCISILSVAQVNFPGTELLGSPTDNSVIVNMVADSDIQLYFEYGLSPGIYDNQTSIVSVTANEPVEVEIADLASNTRYYYRALFRAPGDIDWTARDEHVFQTQRSKGEEFVFTIIADSHLNNSLAWIFHTKEQG